jgi:hypothetical protein
MRVRKDTQPIILVLQDSTQVRGLVHLPSSGRLSDLLNHQTQDRPFISLTRAAVKLPDGTHHQAAFMAVNRSAVGLCIPIEEPVAPAQAPAPNGGRPGATATPPAPRRPPSPTG